MGMKEAKEELVWFNLCKIQKQEKLRFYSMSGGSFPLEEGCD